jgi:hypothetical protein
MMSPVSRLKVPTGSLSGLFAPPNLGGLAQELEAVLRKHGARSQPLDTDIRFQAGAWPGVAIATFVLESDTVSRAVVSHVRAAPFYTGLSVVVHPRANLQAPLMLADISVPPPGIPRMFLDVGGPNLGTGAFQERFGKPLELVVSSNQGFRRTGAPLWLGGLAGGTGGRLKAWPGRGESLCRLLVKYTDRYLQALEGADPHGDSEDALRATRSVRDAFRANGPAGKYLARFFGEGFAGKYARVLWNDETSTF